MIGATKMGDDIRSQLTVVVPTHNRYDRLLRLLRYYRTAGFAASLQILDSSTEVLPSERGLEAFMTSQDAISLTRYRTEMPPLLKILDGLQRVASPYVVLWADDDFMVPSTLGAAVRILQERPDVSVVHGQSGLFHVSRGQIQWVDRYLQCSITDATASERLRHHLRRYSVMFYSLHRTEALRKNLERVCEFGLDWHTWGEIALSSLAVIQGKALAIPSLYMVREGHAGMWSAQIHQERNLDLFDWLTDSTFSSQYGTYERFRNCLAPELVREDGIDIGGAREVVKRAFWSYFVPQMEEKWRKQDDRRTVTLRVRVREAARRIPGLRAMWRAVCGVMPGQRSAVSLHALLRPSSRYHQDFMPIYHAITRENGRA